MQFNIVNIYALIYLQPWTMEMKEKEENIYDVYCICISKVGSMQKKTGN